jgi:cytochrome c oxidase subunit II
MMRRCPVLVPVLLTLACDREFTVTHPVGPQAARLEDLMWLMVWVLGGVFVVVVSFMFYALARGRRRRGSAVDEETNRRITRWVGAGVGVTTVILIALLVVNVSTGRALAEFGDDDALVIKVTGHQWWWQVEYGDPLANRRLQTANEIVIPVGRRVRIDVAARDVIHSFWAPNLHGKLDMIPGYNASTTIRADSAGIFNGRCAEFCGLQHAHMDFRIIAVAPDDFSAWYEAQLKPAAAPADSLLREGQDVFMANACALCHSIRGTEADSRVGPELTHLKSRRTIAAATLANTRENLAAWILDPQGIKPGTRMPPSLLTPEDLSALLAYLESLK